MAILVWVRTPKGPMPQRYANVPDTDLSNSKRNWIGEPRELLASEETLPLDTLAKRYPPPAAAEN